MTHAPRSPRLEFGDLDDLTRAVRENGGRISGPRRVVLEALFAAEGPVSAEFIAGGSGGRSTPLELTTVYRSLEHLERLGAVRHVHLGHGPGLYALTGGGEREYLACERCNRVTSVEPARLDRVRTMIKDEFGYAAGFGHFPIVGLCDRCAAAGEDASGPAAVAEASAEEHSHGGYVHAHPHPHGH